MRDVLQALDHPSIREQPLGQLQHGRRSAEQLQQPARAGHRLPVGLSERARTRCGGARREVRQQRAAAVGARAVEQRLGPGDVLHERRVQAAAERRCERKLVAVLHAQLLTERLGRVRVLAADAHVPAQELVGGGELGANARGVAARVLHDALGSRQAPARTLGLRVGLRALLPRLRHRGLRLLDKRELALVLALQLGDLALDLLLAAGL